jgi:O-glycosyl hydrolase
MVMEISKQDKIRVIAEDIYDGMTQKELDAFVLWQITASLEQLPEQDVNDMYGEILAEIAY